MVQKWMETMKFDGIHFLERNKDFVFPYMWHRKLFLTHLDKISNVVPAIQDHYNHNDDELQVLHSTLPLVEVQSPIKYETNQPPKEIFEMSLNGTRSLMTSFGMPNGILKDTKQV